MISSYRGTTFSLCEIPYTHSRRRINKPTVLFIIHFQFFLYEVAFYYVILLCYSRFSTFFCLISHCLRGLQSFGLFVRYWHLLCCLMMHLILFLTLLPPAGIYFFAIEFKISKESGGIVDLDLQPTICRKLVA